MRKICRICLCNLDSYNATNIFKTNKNNESLSEIISKIASIEVVDDENISESICSLCLERLHMCYEFRKLIIQSDQQQRHSTIRKITTPDETIDDEINVTNQEIFECHICDKKYTAKIRLSRHLRIHMDEFKCKYCDQTFKTYNEVKMHQKTHQGYRYKCNVCPRSFQGKSGLLVHKRRHFGIKQFVCEYCSKSFVGRNELNRHLDTHRQLPPLQCPICGRAYPKHRIQTHIMRKHCVRTHECEVCRRKFLRFNALQRHKLQHTAHEDLHHCELCDAKFKFALHLLKHTREEHPQQD